MPAPTTTLDWATEDFEEYILSPSGETVLVYNKEEPSVSTKQNGTKARQPVIRAYLNYMLNSLGEHVKYVSTQANYEVGDIFQTTNTGLTDTDVINRFGDTWVDRGTSTVGTSTTVRVFERTA